MEEQDIQDDHPDAKYHAFLRQGRFMLQRSLGSGEYHFYPRAVAPLTGANDLKWVEASGHATVYSTTVVRTKPPAESYNVALVDLREGPRLMSRVVGVPPEAVHIGMAVKAEIGDVGGKPLVLFRPVAAQETGVADTALTEGASS